MNKYGLLTIILAVLIQFPIEAQLAVATPNQKLRFKPNGSPANSSVLNRDSKLNLMGFVFSHLGNLADIEATGNLLAQEPTPQSNRVRVYRTPLVFPSPLRMNLGGEIGYNLENPISIELRIYDMSGYLVLMKDFPAGVQGAWSGYNKIPLNTDLFGGRQLSTGVYFVLLMNEGKVVGKTKFAVVP